MLKDPEQPRAESVNVTEVGRGTYRVENVPFYVRGVSLGDIVTAKERDGELWYRKTIEKSGNGTIRVFCKSGFDAGKGRKIMDELSKRGFIFEFLGKSLAAGNIPENYEDLEGLESFLQPLVDDECFYEIPDW
jgi:hypothetical protein